MLCVPVLTAAVAVVAVIPVGDVHLFFTPAKTDERKERFALHLVMPTACVSLVLIMKVLINTNTRAMGF